MHKRRICSRDESIGRSQCNHGKREERVLRREQGNREVDCSLFQIVNSFLRYQHIPRSFKRMNEFLPEHLYYDYETTPFDMKCVAASNLCNRFVLKRSMHFRGLDDRGQRRMERRKADGANAVVWMPDNDYVITAWSNGAVVKWNGVTYSYSSQKNVSNFSINCMKLSHFGNYIIAADDQGNVYRLSPTLDEQSTPKVSLLKRSHG